MSKSAAEIINERKRKEKAKAQGNNGGLLGGIGYAGEKVLLGALQSVEGIADFAVGGIADLVGADEFAEQVMDDDWVNYGHADEWYNPKGAMKVVGDVAGGIGTSLPAIGAAIGAGAITYFSGGAAAPAAIKLLGAAAAPLVAGTGAAGNATKEAYRESGKLTGKEWGYGALVGGTEAGVELVSGKLLGAGTGRIFKEMSEGAVKSAGKYGVKGVAKTLGKEMLSEGLEEGIATAVSPVWARMTYNPNAEWATPSEIGYDAFIGAMSGLIMGGTTNAVSYGQSVRTGKKVSDAGKADALVKQAKYGLLKLGQDAKTGDTLLEGIDDMDGGILAKHKLRSDIKKTAKNRADATEAVEQALARWESLSEKQRVSWQGYEVLGDLQRNDFLLRANSWVEDRVNQLSKQSDEALADVAAQVKEAVGQEYTVAELRADKDDILTRIAANELSLTGVEPEDSDALSGVETVDAQNGSARSFDTPASQTAQDDSVGRVENDVAAIRAEAKALGVDESYAELAAQAYKVGGLRNLSATDFTRSFITAVRMSEAGASVEGLLKEGQVARLDTNALAFAVEKGRKLARNKKALARAKGVRYSTDGKRVVVEIQPDAELEQRIRSASTSTERHNAIRQYLIEQCEGKTFQMSDGKRAVMDRSDAQHLAQNTSSVRIAEVSNIREIVESAVVIGPDVDAEHRKFSAFSYYAVTASFDGNAYDILINVGKAKNDGTYHVYDITPDNRKGRTAGQASPGLSRVTKTGVIRNGSSTHSVPQPPSIVKPSDTKSIRRASRSGRTGKVKVSEGLAIYELSDRQYAAYKAGEIMARALGTDIVFHKELGVTANGKSVNGYYDPQTGELHININAKRDGEQIALYTLGHETTHYLYDHAPGSYRALEAFVAERMGEKFDVAVREKLAELKQARMISKSTPAAEAEALAREEVVADGMEGVLADGEVLTSLAAENATLWEKIKTFVLEAIDKIKSAYASLRGTSKAAQVLAETMDALDGVKQLFYEGVVEAGKNESESLTRRNEGKMQVTEEDLNGRQFTYNELVAKGDLQGIVIDKSRQVPREGNGSIDINAVVQAVRRQCKTVQLKGGNTRYYVNVPDIGRNVQLTGDGIAHGFKSKSRGYSKPSQIVTARATLELPTILQNSVEVNRLDSRGNADILFSRVLIGTVGMEDANGNVEYYAVRSVVEERKNQNSILVELDILGNLYATNAKKVGPTSLRGVVNTTLPSGSAVAYTYNIAHFLNDVKGVFDNTFSNDVYQTLGAQRKQDGFSADLKFSASDDITESGSVSESPFDAAVRRMREGNADPEAQGIEMVEENSTSETTQDVIDTEKELTDRDVMLYLAETMARTDADYEIVKNYRDQKDTQDARYDKAKALSERITALQATLYKDPDPAKRSEAAKTLSGLYQEISALNEEIAATDRELTRIVGLRAIRNLLARERKNAENYYRELFQRREKAKSDQRQMTEIDRKTRRIVGRLHTMFFNETKSKHVPADLRVAIETVLNQDIPNFRDLRNNLRQMAEKEAKIEQLEQKPVLTPKEKSHLKHLLEEYGELEGIALAPLEQARALYKAFEAYEKKAHPTSFDQGLLDTLSEHLDVMENKTLSQMSIDSQQAVFDFYSTLYHRINTENKLFKEQQAVALDGEARKVMQEMIDNKAPAWVTPKPGELAVISKAREYLWKLLKPINFFDMLGSDTFSRAFMDLHRGMGTWARDIEEAKDRFQEISKKHGYDAWDLNTRFEIESSNGKTVSVSLGQIMSIYAYSKRENALDHFEFGGFTFAPNATYKGKYGDTEGIKAFTKLLTRSINDSQRYTLDAAAFGKIISKLTDEQKAFVDEMQSYLSVELAAKGNSVSRILYDMELFGEHSYFPMKVASEYLASETGRIGDPKTKNKGMTKKVKPNAKETLILGDFMEMWNGHVNDMALYHGTVLPMENLNRLLDWKPSGDMSGATEKIRAGMTDMERALILQNKQIEDIPSVGDLSPEILKKVPEISQWSDIDGYQGRVKKGIIKRIAAEFGAFKDYKNADINMEFGFSGNNFQESYGKQKKNYQAFAKMFSVFPEVVQNAVGIEVHNRNSEGYKNDPTLENVYVLASAYYDGDTLVPVKLEIKQFKDKPNTLYVAIALDTKKAEVSGSGSSQREVAQNSRSATISIADFFKKINPQDESFYKYIPKPFLDGSLERSTSADSSQYASMKELIRAKYGHHAVEYIEQLLRDMNGGVMSAAPMTLMDKGISLFKKSAVMASWSVIVQQPSSIHRAFAYVDSKYFLHTKGFDFKNSREMWEELKANAPIAIIKEIGGFDTGVGQSVGDYITAKEYKGVKKKAGAMFTDKAYRDSALGYGAAKADQMTWLHLWEAVKRETAAKHPELEQGSEAFLQKAGERFEDVVIRTQVYDSTLSRNAMMRSKDTGWKMATAFMAEPTTVVNMLISGSVALQRGNVKFFRRTVGSVIGALILNSVLASIVYAARDDDEEKNYGEKYLASLTEETADAFNPLSTLPYLKDIMSLVQGYEVERSDMAVYADLINAVNGMGSSEKSWLEKSMNLGANVGTLFGLPTRNLYRDGRGIYNVMTNAGGDGATAAGAKYAVRESAVSMIPFGKLLGVSADASNGYQLYDSMVAGDEAHQARVRARFATQSEADKALRVALRDKDARIRQAAMARYEGDMATYSSLVREVKAEGIFSQDLIVTAVNGEFAAIKRDYESGAEDNADPDAVEENAAGSSLYTSADLNGQLEAGDYAEAKVIITDMVNTKVADGKTKKQAQALVKSGVTRYWKEKYLAAYKSKNAAECKRIRAILKQTGLYGTTSDILEVTQDWVKATTK